MMGHVCKAGRIKGLHKLSGFVEFWDWSEESKVNPQWGGIFGQ